MTKLYKKIIIILLTSIFMHRLAFANDSPIDGKETIDEIKTKITGLEREIEEKYAKKIDLDKFKSNNEEIIRLLTAELTSSN
ncbi:hypothetical protein FACS189449_04800 [Alphaproteobacteria bacterium]|nr:hypothetical protein FACS189449_04800 [Alphaproteobacteria bacterium]